MIVLTSYADMFAMSPPAPSSQDDINKLNIITDRVVKEEEEETAKNREKRKESKLPTWSRWMQGSEVRRCDLLLD